MTNKHLTTKQLYDILYNRLMNKDSEVRYETFVMIDSLMHDVEEDSYIAAIEEIEDFDKLGLGMINEGVNDNE